MVNDDGIARGTAAAPPRWPKLGHVTVAPRFTFSHFGRGYHRQATGKVSKVNMQVKRESGKCTPVGWRPFTNLPGALMEIVPQNDRSFRHHFGENVSSDVTSPARWGGRWKRRPLRYPPWLPRCRSCRRMGFYHLDGIFCRRALHIVFCRPADKKEDAFDVDVLNVTVRWAQSANPWRITRLARERYYDPYIKRRGAGIPMRISRAPCHPAYAGQGYRHLAAIIEKIVSVTPLSLDSTSRVNFNELNQLRANNQRGKTPQNKNLRY